MYYCFVLRQTRFISYFSDLLVPFVSLNNVRKPLHISSSILYLLLSLFLTSVICHFLLQ